MDAIEGAVSHLQNTVRVSGGGNTQARTTYIALFRLDDRPVEFSSGAPVALADGDRVVVAGNRTGNGSFRAWACRNLTTGVVSNAGIWGRVITAVILPVFGAFFCGIAGFIFGKLALLLYLGFLAATLYVIYGIVMITLALRRVREYQV